MTSQLRIIVLGYVVRGPLGGMAWHHLQYVAGLARLGHDVSFLEVADDYPSCYDPVPDAVGTDPAYGLEFTRQAFEGIGLPECWAYYDRQTGQWLGPCRRRIDELAKTADLVLNLSGINPLCPWFIEVPARVLMDTDPVFTQVNHLADSGARELALQHNAFVSFAENIRSARCTVPRDGFDWQPTRQPVVLDLWPVSPGPRDGKFTTVMLWSSYGAAQFDGQHYGLKSDSFQPYLGLPAATRSMFELALGGHKVPRAMVAGHGWQLRDPREPSRDIWTYQRYLQQSKAEFSVAKHGYVVSRSGWFSERSAAYLASGRPVIVQDTGFSDWLPTGSGVIAFETSEQAIAGVNEVNVCYEAHCRAARAIAEEYFDARRVLPPLIEHAMNAASAPARTAPERSA